MKLKKSVSIALTFALVMINLLPGAALAVSADQNARIIEIFKIEGDVIMTKGAAKEFAAKEGQKLGEGYTVTTGKDAACYLKLDEDSLLKMDQNSKISVSKSKKKLSISVLSGAALVDAAAQKPGDSIETRAGNSALAIRGTLYVIEYEQIRGTNVLKITMLEGSGVIDNNEGKTVPAGSTAIVYDDADINQKIVEIIEEGGVVIDESLSLFTLMTIYERQEELFASGVLQTDNSEQLAAELMRLIELKLIEENSAPELPNLNRNQEYLGTTTAAVTATTTATATVTTTTTEAETAAGDDTTTTTTESTGTTEPTQYATEPPTTALPTTALPTTTPPVTAPPPTHYTVTYIWNNGGADPNFTATVPVTSPTITVGNSIEEIGGYLMTNVVIPIYPPAGKRFTNKWNTNASGTGTSYAQESSLTLTGNLTLYAIWEDIVAGSGTISDPYMIRDATELSLIGSGVHDGKGDLWRLDQHYKLANDIGGVDFYIGDPLSISTSFTGTFDGNGKTITVDIDESYNIMGLFNDVSGTITNLNVAGDVIGNWNTGGIAGNVANGAVIENCNFTGTVTGENDVGGIAGNVESGATIENCNFTGTSVSGLYRVGGIAGSNSGTVEGCTFTGSVTGTNDNIGGIAGSNSGTVQDCNFTGSVTGTINVGGIVGENGFGATIEKCSSSGALVQGTFNVGGIAGFNSNEIRECKSTVTLVEGIRIGSTDSNVGGISGENQGRIDKCYSNSSLKGNYRIGGIAGFNNNGTISECVAMGTGIDCNTSICLGDCGRIAGRLFGTSTLADNYALASMTVELLGFSSDKDGKHGEDISSVDDLPPTFAGHPALGMIITGIPFTFNFSDFALPLQSFNFNIMCGAWLGTKLPKIIRRK